MKVVVLAEGKGGPMVGAGDGGGLVDSFECFQLGHILLLLFFFELQILVELHNKFFSYVINLILHYLNNPVLTCYISPLVSFSNKYFFN